MSGVLMHADKDETHDCRTLTHARTHTRTHARTHPHPPTHPPTHPHTHTHTHTHKHTHTHNLTEYKLYKLLFIHTLQINLMADFCGF